ncbi:MAG: DeoR/GlpR family DNA-binding transcription regulator [Chloroflexota bacterium]|nr:DeoR/GlpR family DNA-binding transcription regulator [Chloroflexota bacterium]
MNKRKKQVLDLLQRHGELSNQELSDLLDISPSSIRRILIALDKDRLIKRTRGGVCLSTAVNYDLLPTHKLPVDPVEARSIANRAVQLIQPGDVIALSGGVLCTQLVLRVRYLEGITVVTNAVNVAIELVSLPEIQVRLTGGRLNPGSFELVGRALAPSLSGLHIDKFFLGTDGLSVQHGVTGRDEDEATASRVIMERSDATIVLADSSKFKKASYARVASISKVDTIVTTDRVSQSVGTQFKEAGVKIIVAGS